ncbi:LPXTG cell wall anchor domain-containing protein [Leucobacter sp. 7(1)]|uniref:LPXTG cell wall anchor domain-containing protein n=1 Tax=Leucobacter sp. 7(1) TaxID=1255613 RepID=UPI00159519F5
MPPKPDPKPEPKPEPKPVPPKTGELATTGQESSANGLWLAGALVLLGSAGLLVRWRRGRSS